MTYFGFENVIEWVCYVTAILFVIDLNECQQATGLRMDWQWMVKFLLYRGVSVFLKLFLIDWFHLCYSILVESFVKCQKIPLLGNLRGHVH